MYTFHVHSNVYNLLTRFQDPKRTFLEKKKQIVCMHVHVSSLTYILFELYNFMRDFVSKEWRFLDVYRKNSDRFLFYAC